jgi:hypothetical protein
MSRLIDLTNQVFGRLKVIKRDKEKEKTMKNKGAYWLCECSCNNSKQPSVSAPKLKNGNTRSCGCLNSEMVAKRSKKSNIYDLTNEYGIGYTSSGKPFYFDLEDYNKIKDYMWHLDKNNYVLTKVDKKAILFHRLIMNAKDSEIIDHIHAETNNNRKNELRVVTKAQNCQNSKLSINNTSGVKGVRYDKSMQSWGYEIKCNNKRERKYGLTYEEAVKTRKEAEVRLHKEFRRIEKVREDSI